MLFEHKEGSKLVDTKDVGTLVRSLGVNPSMAQVTTVLDQLSALTSDSLLAAEYVENVVANFLVQQDTALFRDDYHTLIRAFRAFDAEGKGYLDQDQFRTLMGSKGEQLTDEELNRMISSSADENGKIFCKLAWTTGLGVLGSCGLRGKQRRIRQ